VFHTCDEAALVPWWKDEAWSKCGGRLRFETVIIFGEDLQVVLDETRRNRWKRMASKNQDWLATALRQESWQGDFGVSEPAIIRSGALGPFRGWWVAGRECESADHELDSTQWPVKAAIGRERIFNWGTERSVGHRDEYRKIRTKVSSDERVM
jgi:hypothetical protein